MRLVLDTLPYIVSIECADSCNIVKISVGTVMTKFGFRMSTGPGPHLNIKTVFPKYGDFHVKDKTVSETVISLTWESPYW